MVSNKKRPEFEVKFAPVISFSTLKLFVSLVAKEDVELDQMDVKTSFLYGDLEQNIFMERPRGSQGKKNS